jgi:hypothetical protein
MKKLMIKDCPQCGKIIYDFKQLPFASMNKGSLTINFFKKIPYQLNKDGAYLWLLLTDGSRMNVSICKDCLGKITDEQVNNIFADVTYTKLKQLESEKRKEIQYKLYNRIRSVEVYIWRLSELELIAYLGSKNITMKEEVNA